LSVYQGRYIEKKSTTESWNIHRSITSKKYEKGGSLLGVNCQSIYNADGMMLLYSSRGSSIRGFWLRI